MWPIDKREFSEGHYGNYERFKSSCDKWGYEFKAYNTYTSDGWFLTVFRIVGSKKKQDSKRHNKPILYQHGSGGDSAALLKMSVLDKPWLFSLYDRGYDVWLGNNRGTEYSNARAGEGPETTQKEHWSFTYAEMGRFDLPAEIDLVLQETGMSKLTFIGNS